MTAVASARPDRPPLASYERDWKTAPIFLPDPALSFPTLFGRRVVECPRETAFTVVKVSGSDLIDRAFSYALLDRFVRRAASALLDAGVAQDERVILSLARPDEFFCWFLACHGLGALPVPLPPAADYQMPSAFRERIRSVAADCAPRAIVVESLSGWESVASDLSHGIAVMDARSIRVKRDTDAIASRFNLERSLDDSAFIQYTSGSTGDPKGVVVDHYNLVANFRAIAGRCAWGPDDRFFSWLPVFHDMGLIGGFLLNVYAKIASFVMAPRYFVMRPDSWLRAIDRYRATLTVAPNFAYSMAARRLPESSITGLDLSCLRLAFDGAEPIDHETVEAFIARFERYGFRREAFYPVYGLAECTLAVTLPSPGGGVSYDTVDRRILCDEHRATPPRTTEPRDALTVVSVGHAVPGHEIRVRAIDGDAELPERCVGEVTVVGPSVTRGYWGKPPRPAGELRTGDLGYLANGELYVVDRLKDLIIIGGRNLVPFDLERVIGEVRGIGRGSVATFGVPGADGTEELVVVAALEARSWRSLDDMRNEIRRAVLDNFNVVASDIYIVAPGSLPKTSSGKVQRAACRKLYESHTLQIADGMMARAQIKAKHAQKRFTGFVSARNVSDFPPAAEDTLPPTPDHE